MILKWLHRNIPTLILILVKIFPSKGGHLYKAKEYFFRFIFGKEIVSASDLRLSSAEASAITDMLQLLRKMVDDKHIYPDATLSVLLRDDVDLNKSLMSNWIMSQVHRRSIYGDTSIYGDMCGTCVVSRKMWSYLNMIGTINDTIFRTYAPHINDIDIRHSKGHPVSTFITIDGRTGTERRYYVSTLDDVARIIDCPVSSLSITSVEGYQHYSVDIPFYYWRVFFNETSLGYLTNPVR